LSLLKPTAKLDAIAIGQIRVNDYECRLTVVERVSGLMKRRGLDYPISRLL
jgi:hypothetical protein